MTTPLILMMTYPQMTRRRRRRKKLRETFPSFPMKLEFLSL
jgi:hypothetical protein